MSRQALVSVIIPTYNRKDFVCEAVDSALAQSYPHVEILLVDDGSTDGTEVLIRDRYAQEPRLRYFYQENSGQATARRRALGLAQGEFVAFLDSDNRWLPNRLERQLELFKQDEEVGLVYGDAIKIDEHGREISRQNIRRFSGSVTPLLLRDNFVSMNTTLVRKSCLEQAGGPDPELRVADDYDLWLRCSVHCRFLYVPEYFAEYRVMRDQISSQKLRRFEANERIVQSFVDRYPRAVSAVDVQNAWAHIYTRKGRYLASQGHLREALRCYRDALRKRPTSLVAWRALTKLAFLRSG